MSRELRGTTREERKVEVGDLSQLPRTTIEEDKISCTKYVIGCGGGMLMKLWPQYAGVYLN